MKAKSKTVDLTEFLTDEEIKKAWTLKTAARIADEIIKPNLDRINKSLGQENDPMYLGYACEYAFSRLERE